MDQRSAGERLRALLLQASLIVLVVLVAVMVFDILSGSLEPVAGTAPGG
jgi:hypothetical protein